MKNQTTFDIAILACTELFGSLDFLSQTLTKHALFKYFEQKGNTFL